MVKHIKNFVQENLTAMSDPLKTIDGKDIELTTRGIVYLCRFTRNPNRLDVVQSIQFSSASWALNAYSNIPNPESQLIIGKTYNELIKANENLRKKIHTKEWLEQLDECL